MTKLRLIATECDHLLNSRSWSDQPLFVYIRHHGNFPLTLLHLDKVISLQFLQEPNLAISSQCSDVWRIRLPELRRALAKGGLPPSLHHHPLLPPLHSSFPPVSVLPVCLDGSTSLSACEGRLFSLQARSRQEIGPRGAEDVKLLTRPVNLGCPISTARCARSNENTNEAWGWTFLRPFSHTNPWVFARRIILCCPSSLTCELSTSAKSLSFPPLVKQVPKPQPLSHKSFHRNAACLVYGLVFVLNDEYEMVCYSSVYEKQLQTVDILNSHNPLPCLSQSNSMELAELCKYKQTNSYALNYWQHITPMCGAMCGVVIYFAPI